MHNELCVVFLLFIKINLLLDEKCMHGYFDVRFYGYILHLMQDIPI